MQPVWSALARGIGDDPASKSSHVTEIRWVSSEKLNRGDALFAMWHGVVNSNVVLESVGPVLWWESGTMKHHLKGVTNCLVSSLNRPVLLRVIGAGEFNAVSCIFE